MIFSGNFNALEISYSSIPPLPRLNSKKTIRKIAKEEGMTTLLDNLKELVLDGTTSMEELRRTYSEVV